MVVLHISSVDDLPGQVGRFIRDCAVSSIKRHGQFTVAFSGGSLPAIVGAGLLNIQDEIDWSQWHVFLADERLVPPDDKESNMLMVKQYLLDKVPIPSSQIYAIKNGLTPDETAIEYEKQLTSVLGEDNSFDLVLLGMGPDGHTCSLFPDHALLKEQSRLVAAITDSPKPPSKRITLTLLALNTASTVVFVCSGESKAPILRQILEKADDELTVLPCGLVQPTNGGKLHWFIDQQASSQLSGGALFSVPRK